MGDLDSWTALGRHLKPDPEGNCAVLISFTLNAAEILFLTPAQKTATPIAVVACVIQFSFRPTNATLLAHKSQAQKIKELVVKTRQPQGIQKTI